MHEQSWTVFSQRAEDRVVLTSAYRVTGVRNIRRIIVEVNIIVGAAIRTFTVAFVCY